MDHGDKPFRVKVDLEVVGRLATQNFDVTFLQHHIIALVCLTWLFVPELEPAEMWHSKPPLRSWKRFNPAIIPDSGSETYRLFATSVSRSKQLRYSPSYKTIEAP
jgi:hypothetical protein